MFQKRSFLELGCVANKALTYTLAIMPDIPDWLLQGGVINNIADVIAVSSFSYYAGRYVVKNRAKIADKLGLKPKPVVVPLPAQALIRSAAEVTVVGKPLTALWNVETPTPPLSTRLADEAIEFLSVLLRNL
jgi:hypothetical protein